MSALAGLAGLLPPGRIGVLSPHKKGSLTTEMLISATLPIGPMPLQVLFYRVTKPALASNQRG